MVLSCPTQEYVPFWKSSAVVRSLLDPVIVKWGSGAEIRIPRFYKPAEKMVKNSCLSPLAAELVLSLPCYPLNTSQKEKTNLADVHPR